MPVIISGSCETTIVSSKSETRTMSLIQIIALAARWHGSQTRKDKAKTAYITHPLMVAAMLESAGCSERTVIGGVLHDVLEDTNCDENEMTLTVGADITALVLEVTHNKQLTREQKHEKLCEKLKYMSIEACMIKLADRAHNLRDLKNLDDLPDGFTREKVIDYVHKSRQIYDIVFRRNFYDPTILKLCKMLDRAIRDIEELDNTQT